MPEAKKRVEDWFYNPATDKDAWKRLSYHELRKIIGVSYSQVRRHLPRLVMKKYNLTRIQFDNVRYASAALYKRRGVSLLPNTIKKIRELRETHTIEQITDILGVSQSSVSKYTRKEKDTSEDTE